MQETDHNVWFLGSFVFPGSGGWVDIFTVALGEASEGRWYVSKLELQLASFDICVACRGVRTLRVTVDKYIPLSLWGGDDSRGDSLRAQERRLLPALRAAGVAWQVPSGMLVPVLSEAALLRGVEWMPVTGVDCENLDPNAGALSRWDTSVLQPDSTLVHSPRVCLETMLTFFGRGGLAINAKQNLRRRRWPSTLRQLSLGCTSV